MPICDQDHRGITLAVAIALSCLNQLDHLGWSQVLTLPIFGILATLRNCSVFVGWRGDIQVGFSEY